MNPSARIPSPEYIMFYKSYTKNEARQFDHLYDPLYTTGNIIDFHKRNQIALKESVVIDSLPDYDSMFDDSFRKLTFVMRTNVLPNNFTPQNNGR